MAENSKLIKQYLNFKETQPFVDLDKSFSVKSLLDSQNIKNRDAETKTKTKTKTKTNENKNDAKLDFETVAAGDVGRAVAGGLGALVAQAFGGSAKRGFFSGLYAQENYANRLQKEYQKQAEIYANQSIEAANVSGQPIDPNVISKFVNDKMGNAKFAFVDMGKLNDKIVNDRIKFYQLSELDFKDQQSRLMAARNIFAKDGVGYNSDGSTGISFSNRGFNSMKNYIASQTQNDVDYGYENGLPVMVLNDEQKVLALHFADANNIDAQVWMPFIKDFDEYEAQRLKNMRLEYEEALKIINKPKPKAETGAGKDAVEKDTFRRWYAILADKLSDVGTITKAAKIYSDYELKKISYEELTDTLKKLNVYNLTAKGLVNKNEIKVNEFLKSRKGLSIVIIKDDGTFKMDVVKKLAPELLPYLNKDGTIKDDGDGIENIESKNPYSFE